jgi:molecular chaperone Hsp33
VLAERGNVEVGCEFCGVKYAFDPIDAAALFSPVVAQAGGTGTVQ